MLRRLIILLLFAGLYGAVMAQTDHHRLREAVQSLDRALVDKDSAVLARLLSDDVSFGHSNGWSQSKADVWNDLAAGKLAYLKILADSTQIVSINRKWATLRVNREVEGRLQDRTFQMRLHVMEVWKKNGKKGWQLYARQSAKLN